MPKPIKSCSIDLKFYTRVTFDITDLLQLPESESEPDIKKFTPGQTSQKPSNFQLSPNDPEMTYEPPNPHPDALPIPESPYRAIS